MRGWRCWAVAGLVCAGGAVWAGRPLEIDDADPADPGQCEVEAGVGYVDDADCEHWDFPLGLAYGLAPNVEVGVGFGGQLEKRTELLDDGCEEDVDESGIGDLEIGAKWRFIEECPLGARHALAPSVKFPTADDDKGLGSGETDYDLAWIASWSLGEKAGLHLNAGYSWVGGDDDDVVHGGLALDYQLSEAVQWVGEVFAEEEQADGADTVVQYNTGFRMSPTETLTLDIAGGSKIDGEAPDFFATAGLTWAFGLSGTK
ncbi:MAG: transporter [Phycisphaerae bacterium]|nr:transporter [Phycisphaerae bacterium]